MIFPTILLAGLLVGISTWLLLQGSFVRILFGAILLGNAANLALLCVSGDARGKVAPIIRDGAGPMVDPLPQALILTAIVIGFAVTAYLLLLLYRIFLDWRSTDAGDLFRRKAPGEDDKPESPAC